MSRPSLTQKEKPLRKLLLAAALAVPAALLVASPGAADMDYFCAGFDRTPSATYGTVYEPQVYTSPPAVIVPVPDIDVTADHGSPYVKSADDPSECHSEGTVVFQP